MQYQSQKDRVISESIQEKKEKEDLLLLSWKFLQDQEIKTKTQKS